MNNWKNPPRAGMGGLTRYMLEREQQQQQPIIPIDGRVTRAPWSEMGGLTRHMQGTAEGREAVRTHAAMAQALAQGRPRQETKGERRNREREERKEREREREEGERREIQSKTDRDKHKQQQQQQGNQQGNGSQGEYYWDPNSQQWLRDERFVDNEGEDAEEAHEREMKEQERIEEEEFDRPFLSFSNTVSAYTPSSNGGKRTRRRVVRKKNAKRSMKKNAKRSMKKNAKRSMKKRSKKSKN